MQPQTQIQKSPPFGFRFIQKLNEWWLWSELFVYFMEVEAGSISVHIHNERIGLVYWSQPRTLTISMNPSFPYAADVALYLRRTLSAFLMNTSFRYHLVAK